MDWRLSSFTVSRWRIFVLLMVAAIVVAGVTAFQKDANTFWPAILAGFCSGLTTLLIDKSLDRQELKFLRTRDFIEETLRRRDDVDYYRRLIDDAKTQIDFMGKTGVRLLRDFADMNSEIKSQALVRALDRGVKVRFLVAAAEFLDDDAAKSTEAETLIQKVRNARTTAHFEVRTYKFAPAFSYFRADDHVIFGANFPGLKSGVAQGFESRATPSVVAGVTSTVAKAYIDFFDRTWGAFKNGAAP